MKHPSPKGRDADHTYLLKQIVKVNESINRPVRTDILFNYRVAFYLNKNETMELAKATEHIGWTN